jgi:hypothetical protein
MLPIAMRPHARRSVAVLLLREAVGFSGVVRAI